MVSPTAGRTILIGIVLVIALWLNCVAMTYGTGGY